MPTSAAARLGPCLILLALVFPLALTTGARADAPATRPVAAASFAGEWKTTYGTMRLTQTGDAVEGTYGSAAQESSVRGTVAGRRLTFTYTEPNAAGEGWFEVAADGASFRGQWREKGMAAWAAWQGQRTGQIAAATDSFDGVWKTTYGRMRLRQPVVDGKPAKAVRGCYEWAGGTASVEGQAEGRTLKFHYSQPDGEAGEGTWELAADGKSFAGTWKGGKAAAGGDGKPVATGGGDWSGTRVLPEAGRVWLVVLEAEWERDLAEGEYSFGQMLRAYFTRVPSVQVRHRFFHSEQDLRRWCAEVTYLTEPVYLHISSHGDQTGVNTGGKTVGAKELADCLKDVGDLRLLHFGSCLVCAGDVPRQIHEALGPTARFPISGYTKVADWGGSAVVDFTYLDLVLARGVEPADAVRQTRKMVSFAGDKGNPGDAIPAAGLVVIEPKAAKDR